MYSTYDKTKLIFTKSHQYQFGVRIFLSTITLIIFYYFNKLNNMSASNYIVLPFLFMFSYFIWDRSLVLLWKKYRDNKARETEAKLLMNSLRNKMNVLSSSLPKRSKGEQFKIAYDLSGKHVKEFERVLGIAMKHEVREVWVTAFCRDRIVVRVTATIGSSYRCRPSDDVRKWREHTRNLNCDEIRQYHNHPVTNNVTMPSPEDCKSNKVIRSALLNNKDMLRTFIIFWNEIHEYRVMEYFDEGKTEIIYAFDIAD